MIICKRTAGLLLALSGWVLVLGAVLAADVPADPLLLIDATGKEQKIKAWKFAVGTRHLTWLAPPAAQPAPEPKDKPAPAKAALKARPAVGPEALEFRDEYSTNFVDGILTLIPLDRIRSLDFDNDKQLMSVKLLTGDKEEAEASLSGTTRFKGINKIVIEAEVDKGDMGVAEVKFLGGLPKGIRSLSFAKPKAPAAAPAGRPATVTIADKGKNVQKATDLLPLYRLPDGSERLLSIVMFKKTLKVDVAKIQKFHAVEGTKGDDTEWTITMKDGEEQTLALLRTIPLDDKQAVLEGFLGRVPAGYKLFPVHTIGDIEFDEPKKE